MGIGHVVVNRFGRRCLTKALREAMTRCHPGTDGPRGLADPDALLRGVGGSKQEAIIIKVAGLTK